MKKAVVTGANGFIGCALLRELCQNQVKVYAVIRSRTSDIEQIRDLPNITFVYCELEHISNLKRMIPDRDIDVFFHLAWDGSAGTARTDAALQLKNVLWSVECVKVAEQMNCKKIVCAGSICEKEAVAVVNTQGKCLPASYIYGSAKLAAHCMCSSTAGSVGISLLWPIITNAYGAGEFSSRFINSTIRKMMNKDSLSFTEATQNYDFVYISDTAKALYLIGEKGKPFHEYLIGSSHPAPLRSFIQIIRNVLVPGQELRFGDIHFSGESLPIEAYDCSQTKKDTGFQATVSFADGIKATIEWIQKSSLI